MNEMLPYVFSAAFLIFRGILINLECLCYVKCSNDSSQVSLLRPIRTNGFGVLGPRSDQSTCKARNCSWHHCSDSPLTWAKMLRNSRKAAKGQQPCLFLVFSKCTGKISNIKGFSYPALKLNYEFNSVPT